MELYFDTNVLDRVVKEIVRTEKYLKIAEFQIHNTEIFDAIASALDRGVKVEIITLPYNSINLKVREQVEKKFRYIEAKGAAIYFSPWNIGDPGRTTTAVGRWYSYHGKFIVTEKSAMALSANLTEDKELDAVLIYDSLDRISEFNAKFQEIMKLFVHNEIKDVIETHNVDDKDLFSPPRSITTSEQIRTHWIVDYPVTMCSDNFVLDDRLYIAPFDCKARNFYQRVIDEAKEFVYLSTESFTDADIIPALIRNARKKKELKILTGGSTQDFNDRIRILYPQLVANEVGLRKPLFPLHAKFLLTDKRLIISSVNLNKINLGFGTTKKYWRANTETIISESSDDILRIAKELFTKIYEESIPVLDYFADKEEKLARTIFSVFGVSADADVGKLFAKVIINSDLRAKKSLYDIGKYASILVKRFEKSNGKVNMEHFLSSLVLYYLTERKSTKTELDERLLQYGIEMKIEDTLIQLELYRFIEKNGEYYKIDLSRFLGD